MRHSWIAAPFVLVLSLAGCGTGTVFSTPATSSGSGTAATTGQITGRVHGGNQPVTGARIYLYTAGTTGYGSAGNDLLAAGTYTSSDGTNTVNANANAGNGFNSMPAGFFTISNLYTCPGNNPDVYIVASGGNPGLTPGTSNSAIQMIAALGDCNTLKANAATNTVVINEVTTVAAAYAFSQFINPSTGTIGAYGYSYQGLHSAFATAGNLVSSSTGIASPLTANSNGIVPQAEINTLANILTSCVNSLSSASANCAALFTAATPSGGSTPSNVFAAAADIALNPGNNVTALWLLANANAAFQPTLTGPGAPNDWTVALSYAPGEGTGQKSLAVDNLGNLWIANTGAVGGTSSSLSMITPTGVPAANSPFASSSYINGATGIAIDNNNTVWIANHDNNSVEGLNAFFNGTNYSITTLYGPLTSVSISAPAGIAVDQANNLWVGNQGNNILTELSGGNGSVESDFNGGGIGSPAGVAVGGGGNIWIANSGTNTLSEFNFQGTPITGPSGVNGGGNLTAVSTLAIDATNNIWVPTSANGSSTVTEVTNAGASGTVFSGGGILHPTGIAIDGSGNIWMADNQGGPQISELSSAGAAISPSNGYRGGYLAAPSALAIDASGNVWVANTSLFPTSGRNITVNEFVGAAAPTITPLATAVQLNQVGQKPGVGLTINPRTNLPSATVGTAYSLTFTPTGGSGSGYSFSVTSGATGPNSLASLNLSLSSSGVVTGTPSSAGSAFFTVQLTDSASHTATASVNITAYAQLALPAPNPVSLPGASVGVNYNGSVSSTGGAPGYTWQVNSSNLPVSLGDNLTASSSGGTLNITGNPSTATTINFTAKVTDIQGHTATQTYSIVASNTYNVSGNISYLNNCGGGQIVPPITVSINTTPVRTTTTSNGNYTFTGVPIGSYVVTPSIIGPTSVFFPASRNVTVSNSNVTGAGALVVLGYTVSGTVSYAGSAPGPIYLSLNGNNCGTGGGTYGTTITTAGAYTIHGVAPGNYTLAAYRDVLGYNQPNTADPSGTGSNFNLVSANVTGQNVTLVDPGITTLPSGPQVQGVEVFSNGALIGNRPITNSNNIEMATSYTLQWSTDPNFGTIAGSQTFAAIGTHTNVWFTDNLANGNTYYFRAYGTSAGTSVSPYSATIGPITVGPVSAPNTVSGTVTFPGTATGPLYVGFYDQNTNNFYGQVITSPTSPQAYSVQVPTGSNYTLVGILDQNNSGVIDTGDLDDTDSNVVTSISGDTTGQNLALTNNEVITSVTTQNWKSSGTFGSSHFYYLDLGLGGQVKLPIAVQLVSGPNVIVPMDISACSSNGSNGCGQGFQIQESLSGLSPTVGDTYTFNVTYSDGSTDQQTAVVQTVLTAFATNLAPVTGGSTSTTPTFTWTDPANASNYIYQFYMNDNNGNTIWQIPGNNSDNGSFSSSITSIPWSLTQDPTGAANPPSVSSLSTSLNYTWNITVEDVNGNSAITSVQYQP